MSNSRSVFIGFDPRFEMPFAMARESIRKHNKDIPISGIWLEEMKKRGLYRRPTTMKFVDGQFKYLMDDISAEPGYDGAMSTEFAISRFLTPILSKSRFAAFLDCDMLIKKDINEAFDACMSRGEKAVWCVKHKFEPKADMKMDDQRQVNYRRKNWSSFMIFDCEHPSNKKLTVELINTVPGRDLHRFCWLEDHEIGELPQEWNYLVGHTDPLVKPKNIHYTDGGPWLENYQDVQYAGEWMKAREDWILGPLAN